MDEPSLRAWWKGADEDVTRRSWRRCDRPSMASTMTGALLLVFAMGYSDHTSIL